MNFASIRIITNDIKGMVEFYAAITGLAPNWYTDDFAELKTPSCTLAIASQRTLAFFPKNAISTATNRSAIIEFRVDDVDAEYAKSKALIGDLVQPPTTMPWGNRSMLFRDPDGNLINFFAPVSVAA